MRGTLLAAAVVAVMGLCACSSDSQPSDNIDVTIGVSGSDVVGTDGAGIVETTAPSIDSTSAP